MTTLQAELERLYIPRDPGRQNPTGSEPCLVSFDAKVRAMVLGLSKPADWTVLSTLWQGVQVDLGLPAPAIAVSGIDGYQLWFSLAEPVPVALACAFLESLRARYLSSVASERVTMMPFIDGSMPQKPVHAVMVPAQQQETGRWSAFVVSDLASIFADEPWLDRPPSPEAQANVLARLECTKPIDFQGIIDRIKPLAQGHVVPVESCAVESINTKERLGVSGSSLQSKDLDPRQFLQDVMNDQSVDLYLRIDAAKALLPYCEIRKAELAQNGVESGKTEASLMAD